MLDNDSITAIVIIGLPSTLGIAYAAFRAWLKHEERKMELFGLLPGNAKNTNIADLDEKIERVKQTSNEYDLSIQHTLESIQRRLDSIEGRAGITQRDGRIQVSPPQNEVEIQRNTL